MLHVPHALKDSLENLYNRFNKREYVHPDPLVYLYQYEDLCDREIAGLVASGLAYGRVSQIMNAAGSVLGELGSSPSLFLSETSLEILQNLYSDFKYRFTKGSEVACILKAASELQVEHGSLGNLLTQNVSSKGYVEALELMVAAIMRKAGLSTSSMLSLPSKGSACKRLNLWMRWMVRSDDVDPGGWDGIKPFMLYVPLDTHMFRAAKLLGFTLRRTADWRTVEEITEGFRILCPDDPVKYDFSLTRLGIRDDLDMNDLQKELEF
ncbi:MAG: TIGR02757 family protein [Candidatus Aegiribacteria sp.]|nr:TIGR02757 family protein [Candidatus Aegiribacteria sp.]